jgi:hypothetical protein
MLSTDLAEFWMNAADTASWDMGNRKKYCQIIGEDSNSLQFSLLFLFMPPTAQDLKNP